MSEHRLQQACAAFLSATLPHNVAWTSIDAALGRNDRMASVFRKMRGQKPGWPDVILCYNGTLHGIELKTSKGRLSDAQHVAHAQIEEAGGKIFVCRSIEDVERALRTWGIPLRGTTLTAQDRDACVAAAPTKPRAVVKRAPRNKGAALAKLRAAGWLA